MDKFEIKVRIHDETDLYNPYDTEHKTLNDDIISYAYGRYQEKKFHDRPVICIDSDTNLEIDNLRAAFQRLIKVEKHKLEK